MKTYSIQEARLKLAMTASKAFFTTGGITGIDSGLWEYDPDYYVFRIVYVHKRENDFLGRNLFISLKKSDLIDARMINQETMTSMLSEVLVAGEKEKTHRKLTAHQLAKQGAVD
jgi:hypothetical protein